MAKRVALPPLKRRIMVPPPETATEKERLRVEGETRDRMQYVLQVFETPSEFGRAVGAHRTQVHRWLTGQRAITKQHQKTILAAGKARGANLQELAYALGVPRCPRCRTIIDDDIRAFVEGANGMAA